MAGSNDQFEVPGMEERKTPSKKPVTIDRTSMQRLEKALLPYEKKLQTPRKFGRILRVKGVERPSDLFPGVDDRHSRVLKIKLIPAHKAITALKCDRSNERVNRRNRSSFVF